MHSNMDGLEVDMVKIFMLLYADDSGFCKHSCRAAAGFQYVKLIL